MPIQGEFVWHDLATSDMDGATAFYSETIGWKTAPMEDSGPMAYTFFQVGEVPVGGVMELTDEMKQMGAPPNWTPCIASDDLDAFCTKVKELGGKVLKDPMPAPGGRFALFMDPQGAVFESFQSEGDDAGVSGQQDKVPAGYFSWYDLNTTDWEGARKFYSELFGWSESGSMDSPGGTFWMFKGTSGDRTLGGMSSMAKQMDVPAHWLSYVTVENLEETLARVKSQGGKVMNEMEVPGGDRVAHCMDPQGAAFALHCAPKK